MEYAVPLEKWDRTPLLPSSARPSCCRLRPGAPRRGGCGETDPQRLCVERGGADKCSANMPSLQWIPAARHPLQRRRGTPGFGWLCAAPHEEKNDPSTVKRRSLPPFFSAVRLFSCVFIFHSSFLLLEVIMTEIIGVRFKSGGKEYFDPKGVAVARAGRYYRDLPGY